MTVNETVDQANNTPVPHADRRAFLTALYETSPDDLYLELRCIHPTTGEVRSLWGQIGNKSEMAAIFKQAERLNHEGYGLYFAPCLRRAKQGKAEAAALAPALWIDIDCDGNEQLREKGLSKLRSFDLIPSFIIDSGGGWHGYWLLEKPFLLEKDTDRQKLAAILRGLFASLGGDDHYVKSAASVMRLPDSINTKPERGGVVVSIVECHPDRRYALDSFEWLDSHPPKSEKIGRMDVITLNTNGRHPLPSRTEQYLASGAKQGNRNAELFSAACQLRDAGHSPSEAEQLLVPRHVADGSSEREALATIRSVYSRSPRDPLPEPRETAHQQVEDLVSRFGQQETEHDRPTMDQISAAVTACAPLNAVEWAVERQRLKVLCADGLKLADLDRLYRQAKRALDRAAAAPSAEAYLIVDGSMVFEKQTERGTTRQTIAGWAGRILERTSRMDDDGQVEHLTALELVCGEETLSISVPSELFGDPNALQRFIAGHAGESFTVRAGMNRHLPSALLSLSGTYPRRKTYRFMGWTQINNQWVYVSPDISINAAGQITEPPEVELENRLRDYRMRMADWDNGLAAFQAAVTVLPPHLAPTLIAFALLPIIQRFFPAAATRPAIHLVGTSGSGKSEIAALLTSFYGRFTRDTPPGQWGDTVNTVEVLGNALADTLFWVDDYKSVYADERTFTRFLQSYSRGMGRGRLTREAKLRHEKPCRGLLLSTGETTMEGEASILSRMLVLEIPPWEKRDPGGAALAQLDMLRDELPAFTTHFIQWIARQADADTLTKELASRFDTNARSYRVQLQSQMGRQANTGRMVHNWAVLVTTYQMLRKFLAEHECDDYLPRWQDSIVETVKGVQQERAGQIFIDTLSQLLASGELMLASDMREPEEPRPGTTIVGYLDEGFVYLLPDVAHRAVMRVQPIRFNTPAIGAQLKEDGWLISGSSTLTVQRRVRGIATRLWQLKAEFMGCDSCDGCCWRIDVGWIVSENRTEREPILCLNLTRGGLAA